MYPGPIIDTHFHVFRRADTPNEGILSATILQRDFGMADYRAAIAGLDVVQAVGLQVAYAGNGIPELDFMQEVADTDPLLHRYVGWTAIDRPGSADLITKWSRNRFVVGIRYSEALDPHGRLIHPQAAVAGARRMGDAGLVYDISVRPRQYDGLAAFVAAAPDTCFVLGHMGKPLMQGEPEPEWWSGLQRLAALPNLHCKVTAHITTSDDGPWAREAVVARVRHSLDCFGPQRVMFGTNYPTCLVSASVAEWLDILDEALTGRDTAELDLLFRANAARIYGLGAKQL